MCKQPWSGARRMQWLIFAIVFFAGSSCLPVLHAQSGETDTGEVAAFGGGSFNPGAHPVVGASSGLAFSRYGMGLIEVAFAPLGNNTLRHRSGVPVEASHLYDFNLSFHIRIPVRERWAPYGILGGGFLFNSFRAISGPEGLKVGVDEFNGAFHTGAGLRYYIRPDWGIRPELKVIVSNRTYARFTMGIFYTLPAGWP
jgi:hypothetical protein